MRGRCVLDTSLGPHVFVLRDRRDDGDWRVFADGRGAILTRVLVALLAAACSNERRPIAPSGSLPDGGAVAPDALRPIEGPYDVPINAPSEFDGLTRDEVFDLRREAVGEHSGLRGAAGLGGAYEPESVFGQIADGLPWWGIDGNFIWGSGERSADGPSEEARFVLNPYLLIASNTRYLFWQGLDDATVESLREQHEDFPLWPQPIRLTWWPEERRAEVVYDETGFAALVGEIDLSREVAPSFNVYQVGYNARDLGLSHAYMSLDESQNVAMLDEAGEPTEPVVVEIGQFIHAGSSCALPSGCNNMSGGWLVAGALRVTALPARARMRLWTSAPGSSADPDFTFDLAYE